MLTDQDNTAVETILEPEAAENANLPDAQEILRLQEEVAALKDSILRSEADKDNLRKRLMKELEDTAKYAVSGFAQDLIEVLENLYRAEDALQTANVGEHPSLQSFVEGVVMTKNSLLDVFTKHGIRRIYPLHEKFDHHFHQAISNLETPEHAAGTVLTVVQAGYEVKSRLIRPAMVVVAKEPAQ